MKLYYQKAKNTDSGKVSDVYILQRTNGVMYIINTTYFTDPLVLNPELLKVRRMELLGEKEEVQNEFYINIFKKKLFEKIQYEREELHTSPEFLLINAKRNNPFVHIETKTEIKREVYDDPNWYRPSDYNIALGGDIITYEHNRYAVPLSQVDIIKNVIWKSEPFNIDCLEDLEDLKIHSWKSNNIGD